MTPPQPTTRLRRRGSILVLALVVLIILTSMVLVLARTVRGQASGSANHLAQIQAEATARGAVEYLMATLTGTQGALPTNDTILAQAVPIGQGYYWLIRHDPDNDQVYNFGVTDEAGKLNINTASATTISKLPNMTPELGASIFNWRSAQNAQNGSGAQAQYYQSLPVPYGQKNSSFETIEELLLVKDVTPQLLYGLDVNRNGILDANDTDPDNPIGAAAPGTPGGSTAAAGPGLVGAAGAMGGLANNLNSSLTHGLADYVTVYAGDPNTDSNGRPRVNINSDTWVNVSQVLQKVAGGGQLSQIRSRMISTGRVPVRQTFRNVVDFYYRACNPALTTAQFGQIADRLTVTPAQTKTLAGLVNLNTASEAVIAALPSLTDADGQAVVAARTSKGGFTNLGDVLSALNSQTKAVAIGGQITLRSYRCSADIVAVDSSGRAFKRYFAVFNLTANPATVVYWRDLTSLGWPLDRQILTDLRSGKTPATTNGMYGTTSTTVNGAN